MTDSFGVHLEKTRSAKQEQHFPTTFKVNYKERRVLSDQQEKKKMATTKVQSSKSHRTTWKGEYLEGWGEIKQDARATMIKVAVFV